MSTTGQTTMHTRKTNKLGLLLILITTLSLGSNAWGKVVHTSTPASNDTPFCETTYDEDDGLSQWIVSQVLQDAGGMMWFSTWNGLNRFDGYRFTTFKTHAGDGCDMPNDRIRDLRRAPGNNIYCMVDDRWYLFNQSTGAFSKVSDALNLRINEAKDMRGRGRATRAGGIGHTLTDRQGNSWTVTGNGIVKRSPIRRPVDLWPDTKGIQMRYFLVDNHQRYWMSGKDDKSVRLFDRDNHLLGYLRPNGTLSPSPTPFGHPVYGIRQDRQGNIWLACKPGGVFRLTAHDASFSVTHASALGNTPAYDIAFDSWGRTWVGTFGKGIVCLQQGRAITLPGTEGMKIRNMLITPEGVLLAASTDGLVVASVAKSPSAMNARVHRKEAGRATSLSCSAVMHILRLGNGHIWIATESGGIDELSSKNLLEPQLTFRHFDTTNGLPGDVALAMADFGGRILITSSNQFMLLDPATGHADSYGHYFLGRKCRFSDAIPTQLPDGRWLFGLQDGAFALTSQDFAKSRFVPPIALTSITVESQPELTAVNTLKSFSLKPNERSVTISFAALDYTAPEQVRYAYRLNKDDSWKDIGSTHSISLPELKPGHYDLQIKSTNADGRWVDNTRTLAIDVQPRFTETRAFTFLLMLLIAVAATLLVYTYLYIHRIKQQRQDALKKYLDLVNATDAPATHASAQAITSAVANTIDDNQEAEAEPDAFMQKVMDYVRTHIDDTELNINTLAAALAISRSGLNRKMKQIVGITPSDFIKEVRLKHSCALLLTTTKNVSEVAYACGFSDPKYFSKCFKASFGCTPSEYRTKE